MSRPWSTIGDDRSTVTVDLDRVLGSVETIVATLVSSTPVRLAEHPVWSESLAGVVWVDIHAGRVLLSRDGVADVVLGQFDSAVGVALPRAQDQRLAVVACAEGLQEVDWGTGRARFLGRPSALVPPARFNDGGLDPEGRFWGGVLFDGDDLDPARAPRGFVVREDDDGSYDEVLGGMGCPNGIVWAPSGDRIYVCESDRSEIAVADYDLATGRAGSWRIAARFVGQAVPDGLFMCADGSLWVALWGLGRAILFDSRFAPIVAVATAGPNTTSMCPGPAGSGHLYVTEASTGLLRANLGAHRWSNIAPSA